MDGRMEVKKPYLIICEGDSEFAYVQELNRFLNERGVPVVFTACNAGGGGFKNLRQVCRTLKTRKNGRTYVVADKDIYQRDDNGNGTAYGKEKALPVLGALRGHFLKTLVIDQMTALNILIENGVTIDF